MKFSQTFKSKTQNIARYVCISPCKYRADCPYLSTDTHGMSVLVKCHVQCPRLSSTTHDDRTCQVSRTIYRFVKRTSTECLYLSNVTHNVRICQATSMELLYLSIVTHNARVCQVSRRMTICQMSRKMSVFIKFRYFFPLKHNTYTYFFFIKYRIF